MITSIDVEKTFGKIQHRFMIKTLQKVGTEGIDLNIIKALCDKLIRKDPDAGKDWRQEEKGTTEDKMVR